MVHFTAIQPTKHYLENHAQEFPWEEVIQVVLTTKNPRKKGNNYEIETDHQYVLFEIKEQTLFIINAKRK